MSGWMNTHFGPWAFALSLIKACYLASYPAEIRQCFGGSFWRFYKTINLNTSGSIPIISAPQRQAAKHSPQAWNHFQAPRWGYNPDFATGHSKIMQKKSEDYDDDGSHNTAFKTLQLSRGGVIFRKQVLVAVNCCGWQARRWKRTQRRGWQPIWRWSINW